MGGGKTWVYSLWLLLHLWQVMNPAVGDSPRCEDRCGDVIDVPYPFGIGELGCAMNHTFLLTCNRSLSPPQLFLFDTAPVTSISVQDSTIVIGVSAAYYCYNGTGRDYFNQSFDFTSTSPFMVSDTRNKFTAVGCDVLGVIDDGYKESYASGCASMCVQPDLNLTKSSTCSGIGCCQTTIIENLNAVTIDLFSPTNHTICKSNPCSYAFLLDTDSNFSLSQDIQTTSFPTTFPAPPVALDWVVSRVQGCEGLCGPKARCLYSDNALGYRCSCQDGYHGNPYLPKGCQDIDECKNSPCQGSCKNTEGGYICKCPIGMESHGKDSCQLSPVTTIIAVVGSITFFVIASLLIFIICMRKKKQNNFMKNGGELLKNQRMKIFSEAELKKATKIFDKDQLLGEGGFGYVYKGVLEGGIVIAVKKPKNVDKIEIGQDFLHEIATVSQVNHKNVVKLLGLCLETKVPLLVYEFISNGTLYQHIHDRTSSVLRSWSTRLRVITEIAFAIDYLHSAADPPIIHRDIKSMNVLLDENCTAKVSDFGASVLVSPGKSALTTNIQGTMGYLDPEYLMTGILTEKSDVYSFGVLLVELLTGEKPTSNSKSGEKINIVQCFISSAENNNLVKMLGFQVASESEKEEVEEVAEITRRCLGRYGTSRPTMKEVAEDLARLKKLNHNFWAQQNGTEEAEYLLGESSSCSGLGGKGQPDIYTFDIQSSMPSI